MDDVGAMVTDRGRSDDTQAFDDIRQLTCLAHIQRSRSNVLATKNGQGRAFGERLKELLQDALQLWHDDHDGTATDVATEAKAVREEFIYPLRDRPLKDRDHQRRLNNWAGTTTGGTSCGFWKIRRSSRRTIGRSGRCARR